jgi:hypothetical protein
MTANELDPTKSRKLPTRPSAISPGLESPPSYTSETDWVSTARSVSQGLRRAQTWQRRRGSTSGGFTSGSTGKPAQDWCVTRATVASSSPPSRLRC